MKQIEIIDKSKGKVHKYTLPEIWDEIPQEKLLVLAPLYFCDTDSTRQIKVFMALCGMKPKEYTYLVESLREDGADEERFDVLVELLNNVEWATGRATLENDIMDGFLGMVGPGPYLNRISWEQFGLADGYLRRWQESRLTEDLCTLLSIVYAPKSTKWLEYDAAVHAQRIGRLKECERQALLINYIALRNRTIDLRRSAFCPDEDGGEERPRLDFGGGYDPEGYFKLAIDLAGPKTGTYKEVLATRADDVLLLLEKMNKEAKERDAKV